MNWKKVAVELLLERQGWHCPLCGEPIRGDIHVDHRLPRAQGGSDLAGNLQATHPRCNLRKGGSPRPNVHIPSVEWAAEQSDRIIEGFMDGERSRASAFRCRRVERRQPSLELDGGAVGGSSMKRCPRHEWHFDHWCERIAGMVFGRHGLTCVCIQYRCAVCDKTRYIRDLFHDSFLAKNNVVTPAPPRPHELLPMN